MNNKKLAILGIVAVLMVTWAIVQSLISNRPRAKPAGPAYLIQGLDPANIGSIVIGTGDDAITLKRQGNFFVVVNNDNYPAEIKKINDLITSCLDIRTTEVYTDNAANHPELEVAEENARSAVKFFKPDSSLLTGVIIGKAREDGAGTYVRLASSDAVYLTENTPWINSRAIGYTNQEILLLKREDINSVTLTYPDGQFTLKATDDGKSVTLENIPAGKKLKTSDADRVFTTLVNLRFDDVKKASSETEDLTFDREYICRLKDSTVYTFNIAPKGNISYAKCQAEFTDKTPVTIDKGGESEQELKKKEAKLIARDRAKEFNLKHQGWIYIIPEWKTKYFVKELSDLLQDEEPKEPEKTKDEEQQKEQTQQDLEPQIEETEQ